MCSMTTFLTGTHIYALGIYADVAKQFHDMIGKKGHTHTILHLSTWNEDDAASWANGRLYRITIIMHPDHINGFSVLSTKFIRNHYEMLVYTTNNRRHLVAAFRWTAMSSQQGKLKSSFSIAKWNGCGPTFQWRWATRCTMPFSVWNYGLRDIQSNFYQVIVVFERAHSFDWIEMIFPPSIFDDIHFELDAVPEHFNLSHHIELTNCGLSKQKRRTSPGLWFTSISKPFCQPIKANLLPKIRT